MGKCVSCGKETSNRYSITAGRYVVGGDTSWQYSTSSGTSTVTSKKYTVVETVGDYVCTRCVVKRHLIRLIVDSVLFVVLIVGGVALILYSASPLLSLFRDPQNVGPTVIVSVFILIGLALWVYLLLLLAKYSFYRIAQVRGDKRITSKNASVTDSFGKAWSADRFWGSEVVSEYHYADLKARHPDCTVLNDAAN